MSRTLRSFPRKRESSSFVKMLRRRVSKRILRKCWVPAFAGTTGWSAASYAAGVLLTCWCTICPSSYAAENANCRELERRFEHVELQLASEQLNSALFSAADTGCQELARKLLRAGASLEALDALGATPLAHAARAGQRALVELLLAAGAQINARDIAGSTALYLAAESERPATVALLLDQGASPDLPGRSGDTPLAVAAFKGNDRIVEQLLSRHADPNIADVNGRSAMTYAAAHGFAEIVGRLINAGVDARQRYGGGLTALMWAASYEDGVGVRAAEAVVDLLLQRGAEINAADDRDRTALMMAAALDHAEIIEILIDRGADQNMRDRGGKTALDLAANEDARRTLARGR